MIIDEIIHIDFQKNISKLKFSAFMMPFSIVQQGPLLFLVSFINNDPLTSNNIKSKCMPQGVSESRNNPDANETAFFVFQFARKAK